MTAARAELQIDLDAVAANWRLIRDAVAPAAAGAVVKADGYGLGAVPIALRLCAEGCDEFFVASADEALALRMHLPAGARIYVFAGVQTATAALLADAGVIPVLNDAPQLACWRAVAQTEGRVLPAALHVDTGMSRLGFAGASLRQLVADASALSGIDLQLLMTHLACADVPENPRNAAQLARFTAARALFPHLRTSIGNSAGALGGASTRGQLVRPGIALYGSNPFADGRICGLQEVARLDVPVLQVRELRPGETVGYGATYTTTRDTRIATVALGYADGYMRSLSGRGWGVLRSQPVPVVGRISMDLTTFDITNIADEVRPGEMITVLGGGVDVDALASAAGTLSYEVFTRLGSRLQRRYLST